ncbi:hypothetical protein ILYODFUR_015492 [Ilyodon furcidens]|uniref:Uncharacterized protein n=1 Tax=Ilyodon furcidens TaxID=33524 RepID=A0ABV0UHR1_9TELE
MRGRVEEEELELEEDKKEGGGSALGGMHCCCRPLYLNNCTSWFMGFREVLCVSVVQPWDIENLAFPTINIQRFTSGAKTCFAQIWVYIFIFHLYLIFDWLFSSFIHLYVLISEKKIYFCFRAN